MTTYCNEILPKAEALKAELLEMYAEEHKEYKKQLELCLKKAEKARDEAKQKAADAGRSDSNSTVPWKWESNWPYDNTPSAPFVPDPKALAMGGHGGHLSGISFSHIMDQVRNWQKYWLSTR